MQGGNSGSASGRRRGRPPRNANAPADEATDAPGSTREAIFTAAIRHFAAFGYEGAHVRRMLAEAGANMALAHYYFGSKAALYEAVLSHFVAPMLADRAARLERWRQAGGTLQDRVRDLFVAYNEPHYMVAAGPGGRDYARLMQRAVGSPGGANISLSPAILAVRKDYLDALRGLLPAIDETMATFAFNALVSIMLSESQWLPEQPEDPVALASHHANRAARLTAGGLLPMITDTTEGEG